MMESFFDYYDLHNSTDGFKIEYSKSPDGKRCRFCQRAYPEVLFTTKPHVIPELFGRNNLCSNFECDECNKKFQKYETDTSTMIQHYLALLNIKSKRGVPDFQSRKNPGDFPTTVRALGNERKMNFGTNYEDFEYNDAEKTLTVNFRTKKFSPYSVYRLFLKMGISLLTEEELEKNYHYLEFLNSEEPITNGMQVWETYRYMLKTKYFPKPKINLYKAKKTLVEKIEFPEFCITICFANIMYQFFLPISEKNIKEHNRLHELQIEMFPTFVLENLYAIKLIDVYHIDLSKTEKGSITDKVVLHYSERISQ